MAIRRRLFRIGKWVLIIILIIGVAVLVLLSWKTKVTDPGKTISIPESTMKAKYFASSRREISLWIPVKFTPPKIVTDD